MEGEVLGSRVWGRTWEGESSGGRAERAGKVNGLLGVRERDLNAVGPKRLTSVRPVRPVTETGQTGPAQADMRYFGFVLCRVSLKLMTLINLINKD